MSVVWSQSPPNDIIDQIRATAIANLDPQRLGAGYAVEVSFAVNPDISAATFYPDEPEEISNSKLKAFKLPLRYVFNKGHQGWRPFVQGLLAYQALDASFDIIDGESVDSKWDTYGGTLSGGMEIPVNKQLVLLSTISAGYARLENKAEYNGEFANTFLKPALEGVVFDWDADTRLLGASLGADYQLELSHFDVEVTGSLAYNNVKTFGSSSEFIEFSSDVTTFDVELNTIHPTGWLIRKHPVALVTTLGNTTFLGPHRHAFEFSHFFEAGVALETDLSASRGRLKRIRLGLKVIFAENVKGWSLIVGYRLK